MSDLLECTGARSTAELPNPVTEPTTTQAPLRTRRAKTTTTAAETRVEAIYQDEDDEELPGSLSPYLAAKSLVVAVGLISIAIGVASLIRHS